MTEKCSWQSVLSTIRAARLLFARKRISTLRADIPFPISARRVHRPSRPQCRRGRVPDSCAKVDEPRKLTRYHTLTYVLHNPTHPMVRGLKGAPQGKDAAIGN